MDIGTGLALLGSAKIIQKLLGPTADYIGEGIKNLAKKRLENISNIFAKSVYKLGDKIDEEGSIPPKVLMRILEEGSFCDDELSTEYFAGVLASARGNNPRDDRASYLLTKLNSLSIYQIRSHYIFYYLIRKTYIGSKYSFSNNDVYKMEVFIPFSTYAIAMDFNKDEMDNIEILLDHVLHGLDRESLLSNFKYGPLEYMKTSYKKATAGGILYTPTAMGAELFLWAHGRSSDKLNEILSPEKEFVFNKEISIPEGYCATKV